MVHTDSRQHAVGIPGFGGVTEVTLWGGLSGGDVSQEWLGRAVESETRGLQSDPECSDIQETPVSSSRDSE